MPTRTTHSSMLTESPMPSPKTRSPRPARSAGPALPAPHTLDATHRRMLHTLDDLARLPDLLGTAANAPQAAAMAAAACRFYGHTARAHHEAEETTVFPPLLQGGDAAWLAHVRRLQQDHMWLEEDWLELEPHLQAVARGHADGHAEFLRAALPEFSAICRDHIALEEAVIYPEARRRQAGPAPKAG